MIGGCIDILRDLFGTRFDHTKEFINKYKNYTNDELYNYLMDFLYLMD